MSPIVRMTRACGPIPAGARAWSPAPGWVTWQGGPVFVGDAAVVVASAATAEEVKPTARDEEYQDAKL